MENGVRDNELIHSIIDILERNSGLLDLDEAVSQIFWPKARSYRISITIGEKENRHGGREFLFSDYENTVKGEERERRAETFYCQDLRAWMDDLANMAITEARKMV
ncbi:Uncharacterised protein [Yersinia frederiksenii]|nr:hypothetical protein [Yersinia frederiksenii]SUQ39543.1 Uncharacterised protein [Yersinia frederiksenii]